MEIEQLNPGACKTYLISDEINQAVLIDPVLEHYKDYLKILEKKQYKLICVIDTHTHADHISGCAALKDITDCNYLMHKKAPAECPDVRVDDSAELELLKNLKFRFIYTPGHTQDSLSIVVNDALFTGDVLFLDDGGAGRDDLPGGSPEAHFNSLQKILKLPEELTVYPAHDYRKRVPSPLKKQKDTNPHLKISSKRKFVQYITDLKLGPAEWMKDVLKANYACAQDPNAAWIPVDTPACEVKGTIDKNINEISIEPVSSDELKEKIKNKNPIVMIDVREPAELHGELKYIPESINIPLLNITQKLTDLSKFKNDEVIIICRSGHRASTAAKILKKDGFSNVKVLEGGMLNWKY